MRKKKKKNIETPSEAKGFLLIAFGFLLILSLYSFHANDPRCNWLGILGHVIALGTEFICGLAAYLIPGYLMWRGTKILKANKSSLTTTDHFYFLIFLGSISILLNVFAETYPEKARFFQQKIITETIILQTPYPRTLTRYNLGGIPSYFLLEDLPFASLQSTLSMVGTTLIFSTLALLSLFLLTRFKIQAYWNLLKKFMNGWMRIGKAFLVSKKKLPILKKPHIHSPSLPIYKLLKPVKLSSNLEKSNVILPPLPLNKAAKVDHLPPPNEKNIEKIISKTLIPKISNSYVPLQYDGSYKIPSPTLLSSPVPKIDQPTLKKDLLRQSAILEEALNSFGIATKVGDIHSGPTITSFEVHPSIGVKVQKIKALENDIALNMQAKSIRIVAPIPGKAAVGVEVPALHPQEVSFKEMLLYYQQKSKKLQIPVLLGKGVSGEPVFSDLARMPHLLIAGATGSGKSVCVNTIVMSILMNARPEEIRLLMVDPKKVELTQYSRLPHMIAPVITEAHGAYAALQWIVKEMQLRYEILKQLGLRNITAFNNRKINKDLEASLNMPIPEQLPMIVAIIDEFADLMMVSSADIETPIARIAQMARAVGIHLILATQRPSREVITGIIKANIPCRIAFKVASRINSQIILDDVGAESLLGNGDCLFLPPGSSQLIRTQGAFISDEDINQVIAEVSTQAPPNYLIPSFDSCKLDSELSSNKPQGKDALYEQALSIVTHTKMASTTYLQRKLKIGYARAASLMDELEENGIIGPAEGAKPRRILACRNSNDFSENMASDEDEEILGD